MLQEKEEVARRFEQAIAARQEQFRQDMEKAKDESAAGLREKEAQAEWIRQISAIMLNGSDTLKGRLSAWLPETLRRNSRIKKLQKAGLFDPSAYLATNPDVAQKGADPLLHYIKHGLKEGRTRG